MQLMWVKAPVVWVLGLVNDPNCERGVRGLRDDFRLLKDTPGKSWRGVSAPALRVSIN